jgi:hypothetical protein
VNNDLIYIPNNQNELTFVEANGFTAAQQAEAFWNFVNQDPYLSSNKGKICRSIYSKSTLG